MAIDPLHINVNRLNSKEVIYLLLLPSVVFLVTLAAFYYIIINNSHTYVANYVITNVLGETRTNP